MDGASTVVPVCSDYAGRAESISELTGANVIDGMEESIILAKMLAEYRMK